MDPASAKALNAQIGRLAGMLPGGFEQEYGFACECGCGGIAARSAAQFERDGGAWSDGHRLPEPKSQQSSWRVKRK